MEKTKKTKMRKSASGEKDYVFNLFRKMAKQVPAYRQFLKDAGIEASTVRSIGDIEKIPSVSKKNYLRKYAYPDFFWNGTLETSHILTSTSGSTGDSFSFARSSSHKLLETHSTPLPALHRRGLR